MRMRKKPNLLPRLERCSSVQIKEPELHKGKWLQEFGNFKELAVELGCGKGSFTAGTAKGESDMLLVAIERVPEAMVVAMEKVCAMQLPNAVFIDMDAANIREVFEDGEVSRIYINFCDPWPNNGHAKRRLTSSGFLAIYEKILADGGEVHFKTDNANLFQYSLEEFKKCGYTLSEVTHDLHCDGEVGVMTDYERKFHDTGTPICRCVARRKV